MADLSNYFVNDVSPIEASVFNEWGAQVESVRDATEEARDEAVAAAEAAAAPADDTIAGLIANTSSLTYSQLNAGFASEAELLDVKNAVEDLAATQVTQEDLFWSGAVQTTGGAWSNTADVSAPMFVAPYPMKITQCGVLRWAGADIATSDTSYWRVVLRKMLPNTTTGVDMAYKTTRVTNSGGSPNYPAGQPWIVRTEWTFSTGSFVTAQQNLAAGDALYLATLPIGTPGAIAGPLVVRIGWQPL